MSLEKRLRHLWAISAGEGPERFADFAERAAVALQKRAIALYELRGDEGRESPIQRATEAADAKVQHSARSFIADGSDPDGASILRASREWVRDAPAPEAGQIAAAHAMARSFCHDCAFGSPWRRIRAAAGLRGGTLTNDREWKSLARRAASHQGALENLRSAAGISMGLALCSGEPESALLALACGADSGAACDAICKQIPPSGALSIPSVDRAMASLLAISPQIAASAAIRCSERGWLEGIEIARRSIAPDERAASTADAARALIRWAGDIGHPFGSGRFRHVRWPAGQTSAMAIALEWCSAAENEDIREASGVPVASASAPRPRGP